MTMKISHLQASGMAPTALFTFVACAHQMLDQATPELLRLEAETRLLEQLPLVRALGVFELFTLRDPALAAMLGDEIEKLDAAEAHVGRCAHQA
ncbi:MAG: hypothetical protein L0H70_06460 [Xanthomonadales bacterium]|nr:hypothetical protein [Xanthomonadales bacterium]